MRLKRYRYPLNFDCLENPFTLTFPYEKAETKEATAHFNYKGET
jgi:hypothetical protein